MTNDYLLGIKHMLDRADVACQLWPDDIKNINSDIINTFVYREVSADQQQQITDAEITLRRYASSRCCNNIRNMRTPLNEAFKADAWSAFDELQQIAANAPPNTRARNLGMA